MQKKNNGGKLPAGVIALAVIGDEGAMQEVFDQYERLINYILFCEIRSWQLNSTLMPIEDMEQQVKADLVKDIRKFTIRN